MSASSEPEWAKSNLSVAWHVPYSRSEYFSGRQDELAGLRNSLSSHEPLRHVQAIWGLGGVGKTQLALEYAYRYRDQYNIVWWLAADEPSNLALGFSRLAIRLGIELSDKAPPEDVRQALRGTLNGRDDWLLIFDNAAGVEDVRRYLPQDRTGHVIITSRNPNWERVARPFPLRPLKRMESVDFLLKRTGKSRADSAVGALAQALGDLPLALDQAGACITQTRSDFAGYLKHFETYWGELLRDVRPTGDYPDSVHMTWELACRQLMEESPKAANLMSLLAYLGSEVVPRELLRGVQGLPERLSEIVCDDRQLDETIGILARYALIRDEGPATTMHRTVGNLVRDRLSEAQQRTWAEAAIKLMSGVFKFESLDLSSWDYCAALLPHAMASAFHAEANHVAPRATIDVLENAGRYLARRAQFDDARSLFERALALANDFYGETHPRVSAVANNLGRIHRQLGNLNEAKSCFERALSIDRTVYGEADPHAASIYNNLGIAMHDAGDIEGARRQFEYALQVFENHYGTDHPKIAQVVNNLGYIVGGSGDLEQARAYFGRALDVARTTYGDDHPILASIMTNQGIIMRMMGETASAKALFERALEIHEAVHGENHPSVSRDCSHLGLALQEMGMRELALEQFERALKVDRALYGEENMAVAAGLAQLGRLLLEMDKEPAARRCFLRAKSISEACAGAKAQHCSHSPRNPGQGGGEGLSPQC